ncbi:MAG: GNAT family N-acetyltransferase [Chloroflexi bacterium]|nr:MAG: GNAT family N-acetyltransferase [Chloroflexota bacterium]
MPHFPSFTIRPYAGADESALIDLWNATMTHDRVNPAVFRTKVLLDLNFHPDGLLLAEQEGRLVGFVYSISRQVPQFLDGLQPEHGWITAFGVRAEVRRQGIGWALFDAAVQRMAAAGKHELWISPYTPNYFIPGVDVQAYPEAITFLHATGWQTVSEPISMRSETTGFQIPAEVVERERALAEEGFCVRPVTSADLPELMPFIARHFGWDWVRFAQDYLLELFGPGSDQVCFLVATHNGKIFGYCQQRRERFGPFGVDPSLRSKGVGRVLLFRCLADMLSKGFHSAWFLWTGVDAARLYTLAGFKQVRQFAVMKKEI